MQGLTKLLLLHQQAPLIRLLNYSRLQPKALLPHLPSRPNLIPMLPTILQHTLDSLILHLIIQRSKHPRRLGIRVNCISPLNLLHQRIQKLLIDTLMHIHPLRRYTDLSGVEESPSRNLGRHHGDIDIRTDNRSIISRQFQSDLLQRLGTRSHDFFPRGNGAGKGDLVNARVGGHERAEIRAAVEGLEDSRGEDTARELDPFQDRVRCERRGLDNDAVARCEGGKDLDGGQN